MLSIFKTNVLISISIIIFIYLILYLLTCLVFYFLEKKASEENEILSSLKSNNAGPKSALIEKIVVSSVLALSAILLLFGVKKNDNDSIAQDDDISNNEIIQEVVIDSKPSSNDINKSNEYSERYQVSQVDEDLDVSNNEIEASQNDALATVSEESVDDVEVAENEDKEDSDAKEEKEKEKAKAKEKEKEKAKEKEKNVHVHSYTASVTLQPSCLTDGTRTYKCSCGDSYTEKIPCNGHSWVDFEEVQHHDAVTHTEVHETTGQKTVHVCLDCGYATSGDMGKHLASTGHSGYYDETETCTTGSEEVVVVDSDAWDEVIHRRQCSVCGAIE